MKPRGSSERIQTMMRNLWTDIDALARLARSERVAEHESHLAPAARRPILREGLSDSLERGDLAIHAVDSPARVVTGDSYDFFFVTDDVLAVMMADVSGKGIPAALLMGVTQSMVRNLSSVSESPGDTLTRVNRILHETHLGAMYVTIFLGWYEARNGTMRYANAGHPTPYRIDHGGRVSEFGAATGPLLGILDVERYAEGEGCLEVGDRLVLYTDGVTEARDPVGAFFGRGRLENLLSRCASMPVRRLCEIVAGEVDAFQAHRRQDDATLLALHRKA